MSFLPPSSSFGFSGTSHDIGTRRSMRRDRSSGSLEGSAGTHGGAGGRAEGVAEYKNNVPPPVVTTPFILPGNGNDHRERIIGAPSSAEEVGLGSCGWILTGFSLFLVAFTFPLSLCLCIKVVQEYERAVIFRLGRLFSGGAKGPGIFFVLPCIDTYTKVDLRTVTFDVPPQEVLTKDSVTVSVDAVVYYRVSNATVSVANVENAHHSTRLLAQTTLRNVLGTKNLSEILSERESISVSMQEALDVATENWGIMVERVEIKDVRLPIQLQRAMAAEAEADREARAKVPGIYGIASPLGLQLFILTQIDPSFKINSSIIPCLGLLTVYAYSRVIAAEGEQKSALALKEASDIINQSSSALQLRYLQTLSTISAEKNSTIIFPVPIELINSFM